MIIFNNWFAQFLKNLPSILASHYEWLPEYREFIAFASQLFCPHTHTPTHPPTSLVSSWPNTVSLGLVPASSDLLGIWPPGKAFYQGQRNASCSPASWEFYCPDPESCHHEITQGGSGSRDLNFNPFPPRRHWSLRQTALLLPQGLNLHMKEWGWFSSGRGERRERGEKINLLKLLPKGFPWWLRW